MTLPHPDAPSAMRSLQAADGARIVYSISAPHSPQGALILLHGVGSNHTRWSEFATDTTLRTRWALLRPDLRGHGAAMFRGRIGKSQWCSDLVDLLDAEGFSTAVIAGHCLGANLALAFAARHPQRTAGLILIEPMPPEAFAGTMRLVLALRPLIWLAVQGVLGLNALGAHRRTLAALDLQQLDREMRSALAGGAQGKDPLAKYASPLADLRSTATGVYLQTLLAVTDTLPRPEQIAVPVLALLSEHSTLTDPALTQNFLGKIPDCEVALLGAQHWIPTEQPEAMRAAIESWVGRRFEAAGAQSALLHRVSLSRTTQRRTLSRYSD
jgi:pimeloyl-ACP methyl ester carboxylesterase